MSVLAVIPARGGSVGVPNKNIVDVCGKPLIQYTIDVAKELLSLKYISEFVVSTDSHKIRDISRSLGAYVPFLRPSTISTSTSRAIDYVLHCLDWYEYSLGRTFDTLLILQPTCPLRSAQHVKDAIQLYYTTSATSLISVCKENYLDASVMYKLHTTNFLKPYASNHSSGSMRQDHEPFFYRNGAIYLSSIDFVREKQMLICPSPAFYLMNKAVSINVDTLEDLELARKLI